MNHNVHNRFKVDTNVDYTSLVTLVCFRGTVYGLYELIFFVLGLWTEGRRRREALLQSHERGNA